MEPRKQKEREFHNLMRESGGRLDAQRANKKFYSIVRSSKGYMEKWLQNRSAGLQMLDYGCGNGEYALKAAQWGATSVGVDISDVSVRNAREKAKQLGLSQVASFLVMDCEQLAFADNTFDVVVISGVLHHLELEKAVRELARVLRGSGAIICNEGIANNPFIQRYRERTPHLRTEWEVGHMLRVADIKQMRRYFAEIDIRFFHLFTIAAVPFRKTRVFSLVLGLAEVIDLVILRIPFVQRMAWQAVFILSLPRKSS
jgi:ubiquinone/menaquinone biosynthesis C-methylase UbiE